MRRHVRQPVGDHRPLPLVEVPAPQVHRAGPIPLRGDRLDAEPQAGVVAVATVEDQAVMDDDRLPLAVLPDVVDQGPEVGAGRLGEDLGCPVLAAYAKAEPLDQLVGDHVHLSLIKIT
jgi:hypothetical protein